MRLHIEGMGIVGCLLAQKFLRMDQRFTWNDTETSINAWQASTGCIYPSGDYFDMACYEDWRKGFFGKLPELQQATYCFLSKHPPHGGKYKFSRVGVFGVAEIPSFHLNAQRFVQRMRKEQAGLRRNYAPGDARVIVAHGFSERCDHYLWGWTVKVRLAAMLETKQRLALYMRVGRYKLAYAYPVSCESGWYYAGSSLIHQRVAKELEVWPKFNRWKEHVACYGIKVLETANEFQQGWRPVAAEGDDQLVRTMDKRWVLKPLWSSGIRHAPGIIRAVLEKI